MHSIYCVTLPGDQQGNSVSSFESLHETQFILSFSNVSFPGLVNLGQVLLIDPLQSPLLDSVTLLHLRSSYRQIFYSLCLQS